MLSRKLALFSCVVCFCFVACVTSAQQNGPPSAKPADDGPGLADTMKFIQDKLTDQARINYAGSLINNTTGQITTNHVTTELAKIVADPGACRVDYHWKVSSNGRVLQDKDHVLSLKDVKNIVVMSREQTLMSPSFAASHPELRAKVDPPVFQLEARLPKDQADSLTFYFYDEDLVNQVARALVHAVELCGGGKSEAFVPPPGCRIGRTEHFSESATKPKR